MFTPVPRLPADCELVTAPSILGEFAAEALELAESVGIYIVKGRVLRAGVTAGGSVVGALWTETFCRTYSFDLAVDQFRQGEGIGTFLAAHGIRLHGDAPGTTLDIHVVNDNCERVLRRLGLVVAGHVAFGKSMKFPPVAAS